MKKSVTKKSLVATLVATAAIIPMAPVMAQDANTPSAAYYNQITGSIYDPETGKTTTVIRGPNGSVRTVEDGNTLSRH